MFRVVYANGPGPRPRPRPKKKKAPAIDLRSRLLVNTRELQSLLGCGRPMATELGAQAGAKVMLGRKVMWNVAAVQKHLDGITEAQRPVLLR